MCGLEMGAISSDYLPMRSFTPVSSFPSFNDDSNEAVPRLMSQLYEESIFISIGHRDFQIPRELFSDPGNTPNYFSLGFAVFFTSPTELFPGLSREGLLRPPSMLAPAVPNRSADTFDQILHLLRGYPVRIRDAEHREELLRDCRYFHLKGLEQKLIRHEISFNLSRQKDEIVLRLEDIRQSGISVVPSSESSNGLLGWVNYARPFVDDKAYELVLEIGGECSRLNLHSMRVVFSGGGNARISRLFEVIATKLNLPTTQPLGLLMKSGGASSAPASPGNTPISQDQVKVIIDSDTWVQLDGKEWKREREDIEGSSVAESPASSATGYPPIKRRRVDLVTGDDESWIIKTGQWRLRVQQALGVKRGVECILVAVKLDAISGEVARNAQRGFLAG